MLCPQQQLPGRDPALGGRGSNPSAVPAGQVQATKAQEMEMAVVAKYFGN